MEYTAQKFNIPTLDGISQKSIDEHLGLYQGYVKNFNAMYDLTGELYVDPEKNAMLIGELMRRRSFEFGGMRLHELYFSQWEGGAASATSESELAKALSAQYGSVDNTIKYLKGVGLIRGPGWAILYFDPEAKRFHMGFSGEQHLGHYVTLPIILALDVWEHAFLVDYGAQGKGTYIDSFFNNLNWGVVENRFAQLQA